MRVDVSAVTPSYGVSMSGSVLCPKLVVISHNKKATRQDTRQLLTRFMALVGLGCGMIIQKQIITKEVSISSVCVFTNPVNKDTEFALTKYERTATVTQSPRQSQQPLNPVPVYSDLM